MPAPVLGVHPLPIDDFKVLLKGQLAEFEAKLASQYACTFKAWKDENQQLRDFILSFRNLQWQAANGPNGELSSAEAAQDLRMLADCSSTPMFPRRKSASGTNHLRPPQDTSDVGEYTSRDDDFEHPERAISGASLDLGALLVSSMPKQVLAVGAKEDDCNGEAGPEAVAASKNVDDYRASKTLDDYLPRSITPNRAIHNLDMRTASKQTDMSRVSHGHASWQTSKTVFGTNSKNVQESAKTPSEGVLPLSEGMISCTSSDVWKISSERSSEVAGSALGRSEREKGPVGLQVNSFWSHESEELRKSLLQTTNLIHYQEDAMVGHRSTGRVGDALKEHDLCLQHLVLHPDGRIRITWAVLGVILLSWDILAIPMLAFDMAESQITDIMGMTAACYWSLDIIFNFFIGFHVQGVIEMRPHPIAIRYARTWMIPDVLITVLDWCYLGFSYGGGTRVVRMGKSVRIMRLLRVVRLVRFLKIARMLQSFADKIHSEYVIVIMKLLRLVIFILVLNHYVGCCWYGIAHFNDSDEITWVKEFELYDQDIMFKYSSALHWSLTQFTPATQNVVPTNTRERLFACTVVIFALITFSTFVSSITTSMQQLWNLSSERMKEEEKIRSYLSQKRVSMLLGEKIWKSWKQNLRTRKEAMLERDIAFFADMPESLRQQLHKEVRMPSLTMHPFYHQYEVWDMTAMVNICHIAVAEESLNTTMDVFLEGEAATYVRYIVSGALQYLCRYLEGTQTIEPASWMSECALWSKWTHRGRLGTLSHCEIIQLNVKTILSIGCQREYSFNCLQHYAHKFCEAYDDGVATDMSLDFDVLQDIAQRSFEDCQDYCGPVRSRSNLDQVVDGKRESTGARSSLSSLRRSTRVSGDVGITRTMSHGVHKREKGSGSMITRVNSLKRMVTSKMGGRVLG